MADNKTCIKCGLELPVKRFDFRSDTKKYRNQCKKCHKGYTITLEEKRDDENLLFSDGLKKCSKCSGIKKVSSFNKDKTTRLKYTSRCKKCIAEFNSKENVKDKRYKRRLKGIYGASDKEIENFISKDSCDICGTSFKYNKHFDHNHKTGEYRGALCSFCNLGLGHFHDNIKRLKKAILYLENGTLPIIETMPLT